MKKKVIKNPDCPLGKIDNMNRSNRVRLSLTELRAKILIEVFDHYIQSKPGNFTDDYRALYNDIKEHAEKIHQPLLIEKNEGQLF